MKNLKKLVIASFMLVIAFVAVVSSTYAWFTTSSDAKVSDITIGVVDATKSLLISKQQDNLSWSKNLSYDFSGDKYTPVTINTSNKVLDSTNPFYELELDNNLYAYYMQAQQLVEADNTAQTGYVRLDLVFQIQAAENLYNSKIYVDVINLHAFAKDVALDVANDSNAQENDYAMSSFRLAFVNNGTVEQIIQGTRTATSPDVVGTYGEGNQFKATNAWMQKYAATAAQDYQYTDGENDVTPVVKGGFVTAGANNGPWELNDPDDAYDSTNSIVKNYNQTTYAPANDNVADAEYAISTFYKEVACTNAITATDTDVTTGYAKISIYVWMEGWDGDCENLASGGSYRFGLQFQVK